MFIPIPLGNHLLETLLHRSSLESIHLIYAYTSHPTAEHLFETLIFVINQQKSTSLSPIPNLIFVYLLQIKSLTYRLKDVDRME